MRGNLYLYGHEPDSGWWKKLIFDGEQLVAVSVRRSLAFRTVEWEEDWKRYARRLPDGNYRLLAQFASPSGWLQELILAPSGQVLSRRHLEVDP